MPQSTTIPVDFSDQVVVHVQQFDPVVHTVVDSAPVTHVVVDSAAVSHVVVDSLPALLVGTVLNGSSHANGGTVITVPNGVQWNGSVCLTGGLNSVLAGASAFPSVSIGGTPLLELALSTPAVLTLSGSVVGNALLSDCVINGPATLVLNSGGANAVSASASGTYQ